MTYYKTINGVRYDRALLEAAKALTEGRGESRISLAEMQELVNLAKDGLRITDTERRTLFYITETFVLTDKARDWFQENFQEQEEVSGLEKTIKRVIQEYGLKNLKWEIDAAEVKRQEDMGRDRLFESALRGALNAFLYENRGQLSFTAFVSRRDLGFNNSSTPEQILKKYLNQGTLYLVPASEEQPDIFDHDLPEDIDFDRHWIFLLEVPAFTPALFTAYVQRDRQFQYSEGYFSQQVDTDTLCQAIIRQFLGFHSMEWSIDAAEVENQMSITSEQNFGNALFAALNGAIFNGESSLSLRDFIQQEIWPDPDVPVNHYIKNYLQNGKLHLVPLDYREQRSNGTAEFPIPEYFNPWIDNDWYFGLEMLEKTHVHFLINVPRDTHDGFTGWNDGFIPKDDRNIQERLQEVLTKEFELPNLELTFPEEEYLAQREQFGPNWRHPEGLVRQAINTILNDYLNRLSVFNFVAQVHGDEIPSEDFDDPLAYRAAIRRKIHDYLKTGSLEFLPIELPDNNPIDGESIEVYWQFFLMLPSFSDHGFWVIIPRWPEDEELPYVYGFN